MVHVLEEVSAPVSPALDGAELSVSPVLFHEGTLTLVALGGFRTFSIATSQRYR